MQMKLGVPETSQSIINLDCMTAWGGSRSICRSEAQKQGKIAAASSQGMTAWLRSKNTFLSWRMGMYSANYQLSHSHELGPDSLTRHSQKRHVVRTRVITQLYQHLVQLLEIDLIAVQCSV